MSFWGKISQSWRDSDDLSGHYDVQDRLRSDYARNFPEINVYASDELRGLSPEMQERLLKLPVERRVDIYKNMEVIFSEDTVEAAGGYPKFMSENSGFRDVAANMVNEATQSEALGANLSAARPDTTFTQGTYDDIELQPLLAKADPDLDARAAKTAQAQKDGAAAQKARDAIKELDARLQGGGGGYPDDDGVLESLNALIADSKAPRKARGPRKPAAVELQEMQDPVAKAAKQKALDDALLNKFDEVDAAPNVDHFADDVYGDGDPFAVEPILGGEAATLPGTVKQSFAGKVKGAVKSAAKGVRGLFKTGDLARL